jgi:hypothetical protein
MPVDVQEVVRVNFKIFKIDLVRLDAVLKRVARYIVFAVCAQKDPDGTDRFVRALEDAHDLPECGRCVFWVTQCVWRTRICCHLYFLMLSKKVACRPVKVCCKIKTRTNVRVSVIRIFLRTKMSTPKKKQTCLKPSSRPNKRRTDPF